MAERIEALSGVEAAALATSADRRTLAAVLVTRSASSRAWPTGRSRSRSAAGSGPRPWPGAPTAPRPGASWWTRSTWSIPSQSPTTTPVAAGHPSAAALLADLPPQGEGTRLVPHPRSTASTSPTPAARWRPPTPSTPRPVADIDRRLDRLDRARPDVGPWTVATLALIAAHPARRAGDLADMVGRERAAFKLDVRKLKALGLTESLEVGYRLSPRGEPTGRSAGAPTPPGRSTGVVGAGVPPWATWVTGRWNAALQAPGQVEAQPARQPAAGSVDTMISSKLERSRTGPPRPPGRRGRPRRWRSTPRTPQPGQLAPRGVRRPRPGTAAGWPHGGRVDGDEAREGSARPPPERPAETASGTSTWNSEGPAAMRWAYRLSARRRRASCWPPPGSAAHWCPPGEDRRRSMRYDASSFTR